MYSNGINRFEWRLLLDYSSEEALKILATYSEITFEKVMKSVKYLERRTTSTLELIKCAGEELVSISIELPQKSKLNFLCVSSIMNISKVNGFRTSQLSRPYLKTREKDIFNLIESGYKVVNETIFTYLEDLRQTQLN